MRASLKRSTAANRHCGQKLHGEAPGRPRHWAWADLMRRAFVLLRSFRCALHVATDASGGTARARAAARSRACLRVPTSLILITALAGATAACTSAREPREASSSSEAAVARASRPGPSERGEIVLPDLLAIELPGADATRIEPTDSPLRELLATVTAGGFQVTHDLTHPIGTGTTDVTWTAWEGAPRQSAAQATSTARIHVFPFGQAPVGLSGDDRATVGNQSPRWSATRRARPTWCGSTPIDRGAPLVLCTGALPWIPGLGR